MNDISRAPKPLQTEADFIIPLAERKTVETLMIDDCRWPFGDPTQPDFHFCGKPHAGSGPYCAFHMRRAFQVGRPRGLPYRPRAA
jgi:GcrA cell cycle regulator